MDNLTIEDLFVMLVEPSQTQGRFIQNRLKEMGIKETRWEKTGTMALQLMSELNPDLVISAMHLPDMTGVALVETMRESPELIDIPFMLISSETDDYYIEPIRQAGAIAILSKPFDPRDLRRALYATVDYIVPSDELAQQIDLGGIRTLVVDDSLTSRHHIIRVLNNIGITDITEAEDGREAVDILSDNFFDLLVTDYNMPELDGQTLIRYVRENSSQSSIPILMITSETDQQRLAAVQQAGASAILNKPFEPASIRTLLQHMLAEDQ